MEDMYFIFDGIKSSDMGLYNVRVGHSGFVEVPFVGRADIREKFSSKKIIPSLHNVKREPITFTLQFMLMDNNLQPKEWTSEDRNRIGDWLIHDTYKSFQTSDDLGKYYYVIIEDAEKLYLVSGKGYLEVTCRTNSPYVWSPTYILPFDLSDNDTETSIIIDNKSNVEKYYYPKIEIESLADNTNVELKNLSNGGKVTKFEGLNNGEIISVDNENRFIKSDLFGSNPFEKFNKEWLELVQGDNEIKVTGKCKMWIKCHFPIIQ